MQFSDVTLFIDQYPQYAGFLHLLWISILSIVLYYIIKKILFHLIAKLIKRSATKVDDVLLETPLFARIAAVGPVIVFNVFGSLLPGPPHLIQQFINAVLVLLIILIVSAMLTSVDKVYNSLSLPVDLPMKSYIQTVRIILFAIGFMILISALIGKSPWLLLSGVGAMTAVLLLIFKDTILSFVASIQINSSDLFRVGDWISAPDFNADGDVIDIALHHVKIQNWDKTISTIPTYSLASSAFKNWRGMTQSGGRRIKRAIHIDINTIKFCTDDMLKRFERIRVLTDYTSQNIKKINEFNQTAGIDTSDVINGRRLTNVGTFRSYLKHYLLNHPDIRSDMTFLIRQLPPAEHGLPIEIYVFANTTEWAKYEDIQSDIFDHILAVIPQFELRVYQNPTGNDFSKLTNLINSSE